MSFVGTFLGGIVVANVGEWLIHRYVLHGLGKRRDSFWSFHWHDHHRSCRKNDFSDSKYDRFLPRGTSRLKEAFGLIGLLGVSSAIWPLSPGFSAGLLTSLVSYYVVHTTVHKYPEFGKKWFKHHYEHHMLGDQQHSWCVTFPLTDMIMGTSWSDR